MRKIARTLVLITLLLVISLGSPPVGAEEVATQATERPNVVFILTDDQDADSVSVMPKLRTLLAEQGTTFNNALVTDPLCCPARATFLRGQYSHNTKIQGNSAPEGGHNKFRNLGLDGEKSTVATWLDDAGYDTFYAGKYMNGYGGKTRYVPPGWDRWYGWMGHYHSPGGKYRLNENGDIKSYDLDRVHDTDLLGKKAVDFIKNQRGDSKPFFMWVAPNAPHSPAYLPKRHEGMFSGRSLPRPPSFNEENVSDKPNIVRRPKLGHAEVKDLGDAYRKRLASLQSVDGMISDVVGALRDTNQLDNTYVVYASDNGYLLGEHRRIKKSLPYEESIRVPFVVRGPDVPTQRVNHLVTNNDFAPTVADLAGISPPGFVDGKSFAPLLESVKPGVEEWRTGVMVEHVTPTYQAVRTNGETYVEWSGGAKEYYDLSEDDDSYKDPYQLHNLFNPDQPNLPPLPDTTDLETQLDHLRDCSAQTCRDAEQE